MLFTMFCIDKPGVMETRKEVMPAHIEYLSTEPVKIVMSGPLVDDDGETITDLSPWQLIATPGHSPDHQSFWCTIHSVLFAGDALSTRGDRLQCSPSRNTADMTAAHLSARKLLRLSPAVFACGHGPPMYDHNAGELMSLSRELDQ